MNDGITGSILLSASGLAAVLGIAGAQIAEAIVLGGYYSGNMTGATPPLPQQASPHWIVVACATALAVLGLFFLFRRDKSKVTETLK
jgi:hypothetical protein